MTTTVCTHSKAYAGLDGCYCPECEKTFAQGSVIYSQILDRVSESNSVLGETNSFHIELPLEPGRPLEAASSAEERESSRGFRMGEHVRTAALEYPSIPSQEATVIEVPTTDDPEEPGYDYTVQFKDGTHFWYRPEWLFPLELEQCNDTSEKNSLTFRNLLVRNIPARELGEENGNLHLSAVREGVQVISSDSKILQQGLSECQSCEDRLSASDRTLRIGNDSEGSSRGASGISEGDMPSIQADRLYQQEGCQEESVRGIEQQQEGRSNYQQQLHHGEMPGASETQQARLRLPADSDNGAVFGTVSGVLQLGASEQRSSSPHQPQYPGQPNRKPSIDEASGSHGNAQQEETIKASEEIGHNGNLSIGDDNSINSGSNQKSNQLGNRKGNKMQGGALGACQQQAGLKQSASFLGLEDLTLPLSRSLGTEEELFNLSKLTPKPLPSCKLISLMSLSTTTLELTIPLKTGAGFFTEDSHALARQTQANERVLSIQSQISGLKCSESLLSADLNLSLSKILKGLSTEDYEQFVEHYEWQAIRAGIFSSYRLRKSERCTSEIDYLSCPTLTSCSSKSSRPAGMTKCEKWWRENGLIPSGLQLSAAALALLMGYPEDWFQVLSPCQPTLQAESAPDTSLVEPSHQLRLPWHYAESSTSILSVNNYSPGVIEDDFPLELNPKPVLGDKQTERTHPLELKEHCDQLLLVLGDSNVEDSTYPLEPEQHQPVLEEMLAEEISSSLNPLVLPSVSYSQRKLLPPVRGIYLVLRQAKVVYVGQAADIHTRWRSHILTPKMRTLPDIRIAWKPVERVPLEPVEKSLIEKLQPLFNTKHVIQPKNPSGWLEHYTKNKQLKSGAIATYPSVEGERDPDNPQHWYWAYRYEEKKESAKSDNGYITRAVSVSRVKVEAIKLAISRKWSVERILTFIRGQLNE